MPEDEEIQPKVKSLYKALKLLDYFDADHKEAGVTELAEYSGMLKSSVHNILQTFEICGFVSQDSRTNRYMLGGAAVSLFARYRQTRNLDYRITQYMQELRSRYDVNVYFGEKENGHAIYLCAEQSFYDRSDHLSKVGAKVPLHCTSIGKILLGYSTVGEKEEFYRHPLTRYTEHTITDPQKLRQAMENIIYQGYAVSSCEYQEGMYCVAVPILQGDRAVEYALAVASNREITSYMRREYLQDLQITARKIAGILSEV